VKPSTSSHAVPVTPAAAISTNRAATLLSTTMTVRRPSATAKPMYTAAIRISPSAYTVAGSSHQKPSGEAAWMPPTTTPHSTGARSDRTTSGRALCRGVTVGRSGE
jgi:hypothetical protein